MASDAFAAPSALPHGLPDWAHLTPDDYRAGVLTGMAEQRDDISALTRVRSMPTFENTMEAWERSGRRLHRALAAFHVVAAADASPALQELEAELAPLLAAHEDAIMLDTALFWRVKHLFSRRESLKPQQRYLVERRHSEMVHAGAGVDDAAKAEIAALNARIATLATEFDRRLLADTNARAVIFPDALDVAGLTAGERSAAAAAAAERGRPEAFALTLPLFSGHPALGSLTSAESRRRIMDASLARGTEGPNETSAVVIEIARARARRAELLGFASHAAAITDDETAGSPDVVATMLRDLAEPTALAINDEAAERAAALAGRSGEQLRPEDWAFATEQVRRSQLTIDVAHLREWFEAESVLQQGVFHAATALYGVTFVERDDLSGYHPEVRVFEVFEESGDALGLYVLDLYTRDSKRGGAWMNDVSAHSALLGDSAVVTNNLNVPRPATGPTLLTLDEVATLFHEFGHALHGLFARADYPHLAGTNVFRDFVEYPSQVNEMWMLWPDVLERYARHHETGESLEADVRARLRAASAFDQAFATAEYLEAAWLDQAWHSLSVHDAAQVTDVAAFEASARAELGIDHPAVPSRYRSTYFQHIFSGGYSAAYYSYIWSEVLDADTVAWFEENGGLSRANGERFRRLILERAGSGDPIAAFREFRGRDADIEPLLIRRGLTRHHPLTDGN